MTFSLSDAQRHHPHVTFRVRLGVELPVLLAAQLFIVFEFLSLHRPALSHLIC